MESSRCPRLNLPSTLKSIQLPSLSKLLQILFSMYQNIYINELIKQIYQNIIIYIYSNIYHSHIFKYIYYSHLFKYTYHSQFTQIHRNKYHFRQVNSIISGLSFNFFTTFLQTFLLNVSNKKYNVKLALSTMKIEKLRMKIIK